LTRQISDDRIATELEHVRTALLGAAGSLAGHFGDWGAVSRFTTDESAGEPAPAGDTVKDRKKMGDQPTYAQDIRPLFRDRDIQSMSFAFDLSSYDDVRANAEGIYARLAAGSMPCDGRWPAEEVERFRTWIDNGSPP
jgi:hypothetical protein